VRKFIVRSFHVFLVLLMIAPIIVINAYETHNQTESIVYLLQQLYGNVSALPAEAFENVKLADVEKNALCNKINAVINQVEASAYKGALNKLRNDVEKAVRKWIVTPWEDNLLDLMEHIIEVIEECVPPVDSTPPVIHEVFRYPNVPEYDDSVLVLAYVTDCRSGVANVALSYSVDLGESINLTMCKIDGFYEVELPPQPYNVTVTFLIYAWDNAGNVAVSAVDSYVVNDFHPPVISYIEHEPASPNYNETVSVFVNATEPSFASGVGEVILNYNNGTAWMNVTLSFQDGLYVAMIPELPYGTVVQYRVYAFDIAGNWAVMDVYSYNVDDRFMPVAKIDAPACGSYLAGYVNVEVYVYDDNFSGAELTANETFLASWSETGLHTYVWNTTKMSDGVYVLKLNAYDEAGNVGETECLVIADNTQPTIGIPSQTPDYAAVEPYQNVNVTVEVTDQGAGVREVVLSYSIDEGQTWTNITMNNVLGDTYVEVIPGFAVDTHVQYEIIACDNVNNLAVENNAGEYYIYTVIPEFQELIILIFMITTLIAVILAKRRKQTPTS
jgi:hypothetical protein